MISGPNTSGVARPTGAHLRPERDGGPSSEEPAPAARRPDGRHGRTSDAALALSLPPPAVARRSADRRARETARRGVEQGEMLRILRESALGGDEQAQIAGLRPPADGEGAAQALGRMWTWMKQEDGFLQHLNNVRVPIQKHIPGILAAMTAVQVVTAAQNSSYLAVSDSTRAVLQNVNIGCWLLLEAHQAITQDYNLWRKKDFQRVATPESRWGHATSIGANVAALAVMNAMGAAGAISETGLMLNLYVGLRDSYNAYAVTKTNVHNPMDEQTRKRQISTSLLVTMAAVYGLAVLAFSAAQNLDHSHAAADAVLGLGQTLGMLALAGFGFSGATEGPDVVFDTAIAYYGAYKYGVPKQKADGTTEIVKGTKGMWGLKTSLEYQSHDIEGEKSRLLERQDRMRAVDHARLHLGAAWNKVSAQQGTTGMARGALTQSYNGMTPAFGLAQERALGSGQRANAVAILLKAGWYTATVSQLFLMRPHLLKPMGIVAGAGERAQPGVIQPVRPLAIEGREEDEAPLAAGDAPSAPEAGDGPDPVMDARQDLYAAMGSPEIAAMLSEAVAAGQREAAGMSAPGAPEAADPDGRSASRHPDTSAPNTDDVARLQEDFPETVALMRQYWEVAERAGSPVDADPPRPAAG